MILPPELEEVSARVHVLRDRVLVKVLPYTHPVLVLPTVQMHKGVVVAVGYGRRVRRKVDFNQTMAQTGRKLRFEDGPETGVIRPMQVKPGDVVEFSFRNGEVINFDRLGFWDVGELLMTWQESIYSIDPEESLSAAQLWQQSAGYDRNGNFLSGAENWHRPA